MNKKNLIKGTLLGLVGLVFISMNSAMAEEPCTIEIDGNTEYIEYGDDYGDYLYSQESSMDCYSYGENVGCYNEGNYLGNWYSSCEFRPNSPIVLENGDLRVCGIEYISDPNGAEGCITIQGKNVGATTTGAGRDAPSTSYGNYYQWGDNTPRTQSNWLTNYSSDDNAWGGGSDGYYENESTDIHPNSYPVQNTSERQGPCDEGYHVPSIGEWYALMDMWAGSSVWGSILYYENIIPFYTDFQIPAAGHLEVDGSPRNYCDANLWSSSSYYGDAYSLCFQQDDSYALYARWLQSYADGLPVRCFKDSSVTSPSSEEPTPILAEVILSVMKGTLTIGTTTGNLNLGEVNVSNSAQELSGSFGVNSFWVEDMKGAESGYYTTISVTDLTGTVASHVISANNVYLKTAGNEPTYISGAIVSDSKVVFSNDIKSWHNNWAEPVTYFNRQNTATADAGRVGKWGDNLQIKVNIPAHTPSDTYRGTITYTLYDLDS